MKTTIFSSNRFAGMEENEKTGQLMEKGLLSILTDLYTHALLRSLAPHCSSIVHPHIHKPSYVPCTMKNFSWIIVLVLVLSCSTDQWSICSLLTSIIWSLLFNTWVGHRFLMTFRTTWETTLYFLSKLMPQRTDRSRGVLCTFEERSVWWGKLVSRNFEGITNIIQWIQSQY